MLNIIIVDDEVSSREFIKMILDQIPDIEVVAEAGSITDMEKEILYHRPDLVFLDILLNKKSSLEIIKKLEERSALQFHLIIITGFFDDYAVTIAGELGPRFPRTTLRKPLDPDRIKKIVQQIVDDSSKQHKDEIILSTGHGRLRVVYDNLFYAVTLPDTPNYIDVHLCDGSKYPIYMSLTKLLSKLPQDKFQKIGGGVLINKTWMTKLDIKRNKHTCLLNCGNGDPVEFEISQRKYARLVLEYDSKM